MPSAHVASNLSLDTRMYKVLAIIAKYRIIIVPNTSKPNTVSSHLISHMMESVQYLSLMAVLMAGTERFKLQNNRFIISTTL